MNEEAIYDEYNYNLRERADLESTTLIVTAEALLNMENEK